MIIIHDLVILTFIGNVFVFVFVPKTEQLAANKLENTPPLYFIFLLLF